MTKSTEPSGSPTNNTLGPNYKIYIDPPVLSAYGSPTVSLPQGKQEVSVEGGKKYDSGKNRVDLVPIAAISQIAQVLTFGANKYGDNNWQLVPDAKRRYYAAMLRHMYAWYDGERFDAESNLPHLAHAGACLVFLLWLEAKGKLNDKETDSKKDA